ncbi:GGDEF domain-containing response regulator [Marinomonas balearica]|uniref:diguanylate cyclase n=1 Tax=Marinomonas balearica TaxID=491947 RepID=A0A4R6M636_9GAMM|nr:diguanylate cyclase [Marinomonas balearica]TDO96831.1 response regulator receiver modulated diguanylate cyclase [Marinomonas balearica]
MKVLIAEDTLTDRLILKLYLEKMNHSVIEADDGSKMIQAYEENHQDIDLIILDLNMPNMSGVDAVKHIREFQATSDLSWIPIIFLSGSTVDEDIESGILAGADDYLSKPVKPKVLAAKVLAMARISEMRAELLRANKRLEALATTDFLTGLANRRCFESALDEQIEKAKHYGIPLSIAILDIDHFKRVNDSYGHDAGDLVLSSVASRLQGGARKGDILARIGGEEFAICLPSTTLEQAVQACERYRMVLSNQPLSYNGDQFNITFSAGLVSLDDRYVTKHELMKAADDLLYQAKQGGRDRIVHG